MLRQGKVRSDREIMIYSTSSFIPLGGKCSISEGGGGGGGGVSSRRCIQHGSTFLCPTPLPHTASNLHGRLSVHTYSLGLKSR